MTILVFDSGIGGLTVLREARVMMPDRHFTYVADDAGFPYGDWDEAKLRAHILALFERLIAKFDPELAIIGCNTASTLVLDDLRQAFPQLPFVGTVPAIKPAAERTRSGLVSVLATPGTVKRDYTKELIKEFASQCNVRLVGSHRLAELAEAHISGEQVDDSDIMREIEPCFVEQDGKRTDIVVLACTHYPFLSNIFRRLAPWPVDWLDPAEAIAARAMSLLQEAAARSSQNREESPMADDLASFTSNKPKFAIWRLQSGFGLTLVPLDK